MYAKASESLRCDSHCFLQGCLTAFTRRSPILSDSFIYPMPPPKWRARRADRTRREIPVATSLAEAKFVFLRSCGLIWSYLPGPWECKSLFMVSCHQQGSKSKGQGSTVLSQPVICILFRNILKSALSD